MKLFTPITDEEKEWKVCEYRQFKESKDLPAEYHPYMTGFFVNNKMRERTVAIDTYYKAFYRFVVYAMRHFIDKKVDAVKVMWKIEEEKKRNVRTLQKFIDDRPYEKERRFFPESYDKILNMFDGIRHGAFRNACRRLAQLGVIEIDGNPQGMSFKIKLTEIGVKIVKLHSEEHYVF